MDLTSIERQAVGMWMALVAWWHSGSVWPLWIWAGMGLALAGGAGWAGYWLVRRAFGHERINGAWIGPAELAAVLDRLELRERDGGSLSAADFNLLDRFRPGRHDRLQKMGDREFVSW